MQAGNLARWQLSEHSQQLLSSWVAEFERAWHPDRLAQEVGKLPPAGHPLRYPALAEMAVIDLRKQIQSGKPSRVETYLRAYPELGNADVVSPELVQAEYEARRAAGQAPPWSEYEQRFPRQAGSVRRRVESGPPPFPAVATVDTQGEVSTRTPLATPDILPEQFGRYRIERKLGKGGMGAVYLAHDTQLDRKVALKVPHFRPGDGQTVLDRFYREARNAARIDHPNICQIYDVNCTDGVHHLTMAYVEGKTLADVVEGGRRLPPKKAAAVVRTLARVMDVAHKKGVVHRDLKPANIMLTPDNKLVVMDFGLAFQTGPEQSRMTADGQVLGTPAYMSPEQATGDLEAVGPKSDIYSLGVILYELLTGKRPFEGPPLAVLAQILTQEPPPPSAHRPDIDAALEFVCRRAMSKDPQDRHATAGDLADALSRYIDGPRATPPLVQAAPRAPAPPKPPPAPRTPGAKPASQVVDLVFDEDIPVVEAVAEPPPPAAPLPPPAPPRDSHRVKPRPDSAARVPPPLPRAREAREPRPELRPHRGGLVLTLGIVALVLSFSYCLSFAGVILGLVAWFMGGGDLRKMRAREMDPAGTGTTQGGRVCGIIAVVLGALFFALFAVFFLIGFMGAMNDASGPMPLR